MDILQGLLTKVLPLYLFIVLGFFARRKWGLNSKWISRTLLYILIPVLIIENLLKADLQETAVAGSIIFALALLMNIPAMATRRFAGKDVNPNLLRVSFSYYNIGWFGIPVVMALFGEAQMSLIISAYVGNALYGDTVGYYLMSRTKGMGVGAAFKNVFRIPAVYAAALALTLNALEVEFPENLEPVGKVISWAVSAAGMIIIGMTLANVEFKKIPWKRFAKILSSRYVSGAVILFLLVIAERAFIQVLDEDQSNLMLLMSSFPVAANLVVFASVLESEEENAALLVGISSMVSLVLVPVVCLLLF